MNTHTFRHHTQKTRHLSTAARRLCDPYTFFVRLTFCPSPRRRCRRLARSRRIIYFLFRASRSRHRSQRPRTHARTRNENTRHAFSGGAHISRMKKMVSIGHAPPVERHWTTHESASDAPRWRQRLRTPRRWRSWMRTSPQAC